MKEIPYVHLIQESKNPGGEYIPAQQYNTDLDLVQDFGKFVLKLMPNIQ